MLYTLGAIVLVLFLASALTQTVAIGGIGGILLLVLLVMLLMGRL